MDNSQHYYLYLRESLYELRKEVNNAVYETEERSCILNSIDQLCILCDRQIREIEKNVVKYR